MDSRNSGRIKKYGVCLNDKCGNYKVIQEIMHGDFECPECKKKLSPCAPPKKKKKNKLPMVIGCVVVAVAVIVGCIMMLTRKPAELGNQTEVMVADTLSTVEQSVTDSTQVVEPTIVRDTIIVEKESAPAHDTVDKSDSLEQADTAVEQETVVEPEQKGEEKAAEEVTSKLQTTNPANGSLRLSYGTYVGDIKNGYPHGQGRLTYSTARQINRNDVKGRTANAGDYVIGEFFNGFVVYGKLYNSKGELLGSLNFGVGSESNYESK